MSRLTVNNFRGGLNLTDAQGIDDDQFSVLNNFYYNKDKRLQTRRGIKTFGAAVPDTVILLNACEATTNFAVADDATTLATGTAIRGSNSVSFTIDVSNSGNDYATLTNASLGTIDASSAKGYVLLWMYVPAAFNTNLTDVKIRLGSDSSNYYEWTAGTLAEDSNNVLKLSYSDATTTGTPVDTSIDYFRLQITYTSGYTDKAGVLIDDIRSYSSTSTSPITSYFNYINDVTLDSVALCVAGTNMFHYNETEDVWDLIDSGLTEFETADGRTSQRTRWSFVVYKNKVYCCNGVDSYREWDGTTITTLGSEPKVRIITIKGDRVYGGGADGDPSTLYFTNAAVANGQNLNQNNAVIGGIEQKGITGITEFAGVIIVIKELKIYSFTVDGSNNTTINEIDPRQGGYSGRAVTHVENSLLYFGDEGAVNLSQKTGATGATAIESEPMMNDIRDQINNIPQISKRTTFSNYIDILDNYYFTFDSGTDDRADQTYVMNTLLGKSWSKYSYPSLYEYGTYTKADLSIINVAASANGGQLYQVESGFNDLGSAIEYELQTKEYDFGDPSTLKSFSAVDIYGLKSEGQNISIEVFVDNESISSAEITDAMLDTNASPVTIGTEVIGTNVIGGGPSSDDLELLPYRIRIPMADTGITIKIKMSSNVTPIQWTLDRMRFEFDSNVLDLFYTDNLA